jgi:hypothetical protein
VPFIPNEADAAFATQAAPDSQDFEALRAGSDATGVVTGCAVSAQGSPDMTVAVAAGIVSVAGSRVNVAAGNVTLTADGTNPRNSIVVVSSAGVKSVVDGTPTASPADPPFPAIPANSVLLAGVHVPAADTTIASNQITDKRVFVVPPDPTTSYDLAKARDIPLVKERSQVVTLASGRNQIHALVLAKNRLFATTQTSPSYLIRFNNLEDLTDQTEIQFANDGAHNGSDSMVYVPETDRLYVQFDGTPVTIAEVNPDTLATTDVISNAGKSDANTICSDGTNLYIGVRGSNEVLKYRLSDFTLQGTATLTRGSVHASLYDGTDLFVTGSTSPGWVSRITTSSMTVAETADFATGMNIPTDDLTSVGDYLWVGCEISNDLSVLRIAKAALTTQTKVAYTSNNVFGMHYDGRYIWIGGGGLYCIDPDTLDQAEMSWPVGSTPNEIVSDGSGRLFLSAYTSPAQVARIFHGATLSRRFGIAPKLPVGSRGATVLPVGKIFVDSTTRATSGTTEGTLGQASIGASILDTDGMILRVTVAGSFAANANNKRIAIRLGSANYMFDTGLLPFNDARWKFMLEITRTGAATQDWSAFFISDSSVMATDVQLGTAAADLATTQFLAVRGQSPSAAGEVVQEQMMVEVIS